jgi:hypothetical protein
MPGEKLVFEHVIARRFENVAFQEHFDSAAGWRAGSLRDEIIVCFGVDAALHVRCLCWQNRLGTILQLEFRNNNVEIGPGRGRRVYSFTRNRQLKLVRRVFHREELIRVIGMGVDLAIPIVLRVELQRVLTVQQFIVFQFPSPHRIFRKPGKDLDFGFLDRELWIVQLVNDLNIVF